MNKNTIHNFNLVIKNSAYTERPEDLTKTIIKELAEVSKEISQHKDIVQVWQEQNTLNTVINNIGDSVGEGVFDTNAVIETATSPNITSSASESHFFAPSFNASIGRDASDTTERKIINSFTSASNTLPISEAENIILDNPISQIYESIESKQMLTVPQTLSAEPSVELIKAEIKKKLDLAVKENDIEIIQYWSRIQKAFDEGATAADFYEKPNEMLFTQMYVALKQSSSSFVDIQNFNWEIVREKMIKAIDANILKGFISKVNKDRWQIIKNQLLNEKINIANLFEQYDELFLLLKEVEGLDNLPGSITITTKTKIYPNLSADKTYASIGREDVYVFLKNVSEKDSDGSAVNKGAVQIRNSTSSSFIVGESLEFFIDEAFINQKSHQKEDINWVVCNTNSNKETIFKNEGTSFSYNFDKPGIYRIDAYGKYHTVKQKKSAATATFIELKVVAQDIIITPPANAKAEFIRPFAEEKTFRVALKNTEVQTINPLKLYYQIETTITGKTTIISEEKELDSTGSIKLAMPNLGTYKIKVISKDQYGLVKEFKTSVINNEVMSIGIKDSSDKEVFLLGDSSNSLTLEVKKYKIDPAVDKEKEGVKWMIYDSSNKPYLPAGEIIINENGDSKKPYIHKWDLFPVHIPKKEGHYTIEAYLNDKKGPKNGVIYKIEVKQPEIAEACWAWSGGSKKITSGFSGESNYIKANIPHYDIQKVRIYFYLNDKKTNHYIDVKTNEKGEIFEKINFDSNFQKLIGFHDRKDAKIGFTLLGIQNSKPYPFKSPANYDTNTTMSLTADKKVLDVYFTYNGNRVTPEDEVPFGKKGAIVTIVAKTQNMIGEEVALTAHKVSEKPSFTSKAIVNSEGVATTSFLLKNLDKKLKLGSKINYYAGVEGYSTKHFVNKVLVMIVGEGKINRKEIIDEKDPQLIWGSRVSKEFRIKVVKICKNIEEKKDVAFSPNVLMNIMAFETVNTFSPKAGTFKNIMDDDKKAGFVGLIQFGKDASDHLKIKRSELYNMTAEKQLDYVEKWFLLKTKNELKSATDIYLSVNYPVKAGKGHLDHEVVYGDPNAAYRANKPFLREADEIDENGKKVGIDGGKTYVWEVREALEESEKEGQYARNIWCNPLDKMELRGWYSTWRPEDSNDGIVPTRTAGKHDGLDLYAPVGTPVFACVDGVRVRVGPNPSNTYGNTITIKGFYNGKEYYFFYAHLSETFIKIGEKVKAGKKIGLTGKTGNARDLLAKMTHLHFEVRNSSASQGASLKPFKAISELKESVNINPNKENQK
ncbi:M23 family metallopeptidase [Flavobacterium sp. S87F.05.LMB.W.Kidney.N]|uniref:M23 family metallopeptidase n=1 Tax=Flavobacterium sp. S87F.05.LMB.W.Kidney.N TaxID=1278758 RepID=UPI0010669BEF|nr:M23 family metallopeptidase [Flavobacterium sp. S87F.05.LMB.W.Kidney.N]TDX11215.1 peptidase M23-like protein [Flavobacterium sp. S87F.05.LMB.W.Kidney.N]